MNDGDSPPKHQRKPTLSAEDQALWDHVAHSVSRPRQPKHRIPAIATGEPRAAHVIERHEQRLMAETGLSHPPVPALRKAMAATQHAHHSAAHKPPPLADFDRRAVRRIRSGHIEIEARLDLHGMRQEEAHRALRAFLAGCRSRGLRWVLVITGKGRFQEGAQSSLADASGDRGVLKRSVPRWLADPDLRPIIVSYTTAALHHGGEGALYVQLRLRNLS